MIRKKRNRMKKIFTLVLCGMVVITASAQDIHFSQFYETAILRNPALMGTYKGDYKVVAVYRSQWDAISKPFRTGMISGETRLPVKGQSGDYFTAGILTFFDRAGSIDLQTVGIYPSLSFSKYLSEESRTFITAGFTGGFIQRSFDPSKMTTNLQYESGRHNPILPTGESFSNNRLTNWDLGAGIAVNSAAYEERLTYYAGISSYHFSSPKVSFDQNNTFARLDVKWNISGGGSYRLTDQYGIRAHLNYSRQGVYNEFILGGLLGWKRITNNEADPELSVYGGVFYRFNDAAIPTFKVDYKNLSITTSYDFTISSLRPANNGNGGFEISVMHSGLFNNEKYERSRTICPKPW